ncbi:MAG TPA: hypothetical protein VFQ45_07530 [Longimicrobium sp.]|nr:hypothetical protein [Longimicrobium sp.]
MPTRIRAAALALLLLASAAACAGRRTYSHLDTGERLVYVPETVPELPEQRQDARALSGTWSGTYGCWQGETGLELRLRGARSGEVTAVFRFFPVASNTTPAVAKGSYRMRGAYGTDGRLVLRPHAWIDAPANYVMVSLDGRVSGGRFTGTVSECEMPFSVERG